MLDKRGNPIQCRAILDCGSQINLFTNSCRSRLGLNLERSEASFTVAGAAQMTSMTSKTSACSLFSEANGPSKGQVSRP